MKQKTKIKAGSLSYNHNEKLVRRKKLAIKSGVRAGSFSWGSKAGLMGNHNEKLVRRP
jgi:hypothetical protein